MNQPLMRQPSDLPSSDMKNSTHLLSKHAPSVGHGAQATRPLMGRQRPLARWLRATAVGMLPVYLVTSMPGYLLAQVEQTAQNVVMAMAEGLEPTPPAIQINRTLPPGVIPPNQPGRSLVPGMVAPLHFSANPKDEEFVNTRFLPEPLVPTSAKTSAGENGALAKALSACGAMAEDNPVLDEGQCLVPLRQFLANHPNSRWTLALDLNIGLIDRKTGYWTQALDAWEQAWTAGKDVTEPRARALADRAVAELAELNARLGRYERLQPLFAELDETHRLLHGAAQDKLAGARQGLWMMDHQPDRAFRCGPMALNSLQRAQDPRAPLDPRVFNASSTRKGIALSQVAALSRDVGRPMQMAYRISDKRNQTADFVTPAVVHWKVGHYAALVEQRQGRYRIDDPTFGNTIWVSRAALEAETDGYFLLAAHQALPANWRGVEEAEGNQVWGKGVTNGRDPDDTSCWDVFCMDCPSCLLAGPDSGGDDGGNGVDSGFGGGGSQLAQTNATGPQASNGSTIGMAAYNMQAMLTSLSITDTPLSYKPPRGPRVDFDLRYSQHEANQPAVFSYWNMGQKWTSNWFSSVQFQTVSITLYAVTGNVAHQITKQVPVNVTLYLPGGGLVNYGTPDNFADIAGLNGVSVPSNTPTVNFFISWQARFTPQEKAVGALQQDPATGAFTRSLPDGSTDTFAQPGPTGTQLFLSQRSDASGNTTVLSYDSNLRLVAVTDALGQVTTLTYALGSDPLKVTQVTDPFGRSCTLAYNPQGQLQTITDPVGIQSSFGYQAGSDFINNLTTPYGTTTFAYADASTDPSLGTTAWLEATDPYGDKQRVEFNQNGDVTGIPYSEPAPAGISTFPVLYGRNAFFWDKKAYQAAHHADGTFDYSQARLFHFLHGIDTTVCSGVLESTKSPLESRVWRYYQGQNSAGFVNVGMSAQPAIVARLLDDGSTQTYQYQYNNQQKLVQATDPLGRVMNYDYNPISDVNAGTDLVGIRCTTQGLNEQLMSATYDAAHRPLTMTDAAGQTTTMTYNGFGQVQTTTDPTSRTVSYQYDGQGYLQEVDGFDPSLRSTFTYDSFGRLASTTSYPDGYTLQIGYDTVGGNPLATLNRPVSATFPDGSYTEADYTRLDAEWLRDREGNWTHRLTNKLRQNVASIDPLGQITQFGYCKCGQLVRIVDPNGNVTQWKLDAAGRKQAKVYADNTEVDYTYENNTSRLHRVTDAKGQTTTYQYNPDDSLAGVTYAGSAVPTPGVSYTYDPLRGRLLTMQDGIGTTSYGYYPLGTFGGTAGTAGAGRVQSVSGPFPNETVSYRYDALGRVTTRTVDGVDETYGFDALGRLQSDTNALGSFTYGYDGTTGRLGSVAYPNGVQALYAYQENNTQDRRLSQIKHLLPSGATLDQFDYGYAGPLGRISHWGQQQPGAAAGALVTNDYDLSYDAVGQLTRAVLNDDPGNPGSGVWSYDAAGNRVGVQAGSGMVSTATPTATNALFSVTGGGKVRVAGSLSEWAQVQVNGQTASLNPADNTFEAFVALPTGQQTLTIQATDASGNAATSRFQLTVAAGVGESFGYDAGGNTTALTPTALTPTDSGTPPQTLEWDACDRVTAINTGTHRTEFIYDGNGERIRITEKENSEVVSDRLYVENEERDATNSQVLRRFFSQGEQRLALDGSVYFYMYDHLGSVREVVDNASHTLSAYQFGPWGDRTIILCNLDTEVGFAGFWYHQPSALQISYYRIYNSSTGTWLSRDPLGEKEDYNSYRYVLNNPVGLFDPLGLAWESTQAQGVHYNERQGGSRGFGFGLAVQDGKLVPVPLGGNHAYDAKQARQILADTVADKSQWGDILRQMESNVQNPSYRDNARCIAILKAARIAGVLSLLGTAMGAISASDSAMDAYQKLNSTGDFTQYDIISLMTAVSNSGSPGAGVINAQLLNLMKP